MADETTPIVRKICLPLFNRASYSRCKKIIDNILLYEGVELTIVISSGLLESKFGNGQEYIKSEYADDPSLKVKVICITPSDGTHLSMAKVSAELLDKLATFYNEEKFDLVVSFADRYEVLPSTMAASFLNIPVCHIQAGELTGNIDDKIRHAVSMLSDYAISHTNQSKQNLINMGFPNHKIRLTGCPGIALMSDEGIHYKQCTKRKTGLNHIVIFHPETENSEEAYDQTRLVLNALLEFVTVYDDKLHWFYPNPDPGREEIIKYLDENIKNYPKYIVKAENMPPLNFLRFLSQACTIIGNSSCGIREASYLGVPAINIGERQRNREQAENCHNIGYYPEKIKRTLEMLRLKRRYYPSRLYFRPNSGPHIAKFLIDTCKETRKGLKFKHTL